MYEDDIEDIHKCFCHYTISLALIPGHNKNGFAEMVLMMRDDIEDNLHLLTRLESRRLIEVDNFLRDIASEVLEQCEEFMIYYRNRFNVPRSRWWWYLDVSQS